MKRFRICTLHFALCITVMLILAASFAMTSEGPARNDTGFSELSQSEEGSPTEFMSTDELEVGMKGIGRTVFSGREISEFDVEIIGVLKNVYPKGDLILVRLKNDILDKTGMIAGMSGSPVYIDGKLIGAVAYGWGFTEETIAGVTPIMEMLRLLDEDAGIGSTGCFGKLNLVKPFSVGRQELKEIVVNPYAAPEYNPSAMVLTPIATPVMVGGFTQVIMNEMEQVLKGFGLFPLQGGGTEDGTSADIVPGAVIGAQLLRGDCELTALGTLTYCSGGKVLGFGHPFLAAGKADFPMTGGSIHTIVPSQFFSFKLGSSTAPFGRINKDGRVAISGEVGKFARLIPLDVVVKTPDEKKEFSYQMIRDGLWSPALLNLCVFNSILSTCSPLEKAAAVNMSIRLEDYAEPVIIKNIFGGDSPVREWVESVTNSLKGIMDNRFRKVDIADIHLEVELYDTPLSAIIEGVRVDKLEVKPGEDIGLTVILKPYGAEFTPLRTTLTIPEGLPDCELMVTVSDAKSSIQETGARNPEKLKPHSFEQLLELLQETEKNNEVIVRVFTPLGGVSIRGEELPSLPPSMLSIMTSSMETGIRSSAGEIFRRIPTEWVISGTQRLRIKVRGIK